MHISFQIQYSSGKEARCNQSRLNSISFLLAFLEGGGGVIDVPLNSYGHVGKVSSPTHTLAYVECMGTKYSFM